MSGPVFPITGLTGWHMLLGGLALLVLMIAVAIRTQVQARRQLEQTRHVARADGFYGFAPRDVPNELEESEAA